MSRAYRITVKESISRELMGADEICTRLELLEILPAEQMAALLKEELRKNGFTETEEGTMKRNDEAGVVVEVDPCNGEVSVRSEIEENITLEAKREATGYDDFGPGEKGIRDRVRDQLKQDLEKKVEKESERLQTQATEALEKHLEELQPELNKIINKVTRDALKEKAGQMGTIKEIAEDGETGSLTIKVEV